MNSVQIRVKPTDPATLEPEALNDTERMPKLEEQVDEIERTLHLQECEGQCDHVENTTQQHINNLDTEISACDAKSDKSGSLPTLDEFHVSRPSSPNFQMANIARTLQLARSWVKRPKRPETPPRVDSFLEKLEMAGPATQEVSKWSAPSLTSLKHYVIDPSKPFLYRWQVVVFFAVLYNWIFIIARASFRDLHERYLAAWFILDYTCDIVYILDMVVQFRTGKGELD